MKKADAIEGGANDATKKVALAVLSHLVRNTPVDTSQALSNWQVGIGAPVHTTIDPIVYGSYGSTQAQSAAGAIAKAKLQLASKRPGQPIFISNAIHYIKELDDGTIKSNSKPSGFVERAMIIARNEAKDVKLNI